MNTSNYELLIPLPNSSDPNNPTGEVTNVDVSGANALGEYLNTIIKLVIGLSAVLAMLMIIWGGMQYITSELPGVKGEGKKKIMDAVVGLLVALGAWLILNTINPSLLNTNVNVEKVTIQFTEGPEVIAASSDICGQTTIFRGKTLTACNQNELTTMPNFMGHNITINQAVYNDFQAINTTWRNSTDPKIRNYVITSIGSYNGRKAIGSNPPVASAHAFGLALDINESTNPYSSSISPCVTDMPAAFVKLFTDTKEVGWGGYWVSQKDTMHFSLLEAEATRYTSGTCSGLIP